MMSKKIFLGWALVEILRLEININQYKPLKGSSYIPLPKDIKMKKAVINIKNLDQQCFKWCILAHLHPIDVNPERVNHYFPYIDELSFNGIEFPVTFKDIPKFENQNGISVNVFGVENIFDSIISQYNNEIIVLYHTSARKSVHVNLLFIADNIKTHFCLIRNMSRLIRSQLSKHSSTKFICDGCLIFFNDELQLENHMKHDCNHIMTKLPSLHHSKIDKQGNIVASNILKFQDFEKSLKIPFTFYCDSETIMSPIATCIPNIDNSFTQQTHLHIPHSFSYYIKCAFDDSLSKLELYRGENAAKKFISKLEQDVKHIQSIFKTF